MISTVRQLTLNYNHVINAIKVIILTSMEFANSLILFANSQIYQTAIANLVIQDIF